MTLVLRPSWSQEALGGIAQLTTKHVENFSRLQYAVPPGVDMETLLRKAPDPKPLKRLGKGRIRRRRTTKRLGRGRKRAAPRRRKPIRRGTRAGSALPAAADAKHLFFSKTHRSMSGKGQPKATPKGTTVGTHTHAWVCAVCGTTKKAQEAEDHDFVYDAVSW